MLTRLAVVGFVLAVPGFAATPEDLFGLKNFTSVSLSADGAMLAFVTREASLKEDKYRSTLWIVPAAGGARRVSLESADSPAWSPDGKKLACISSRSGRPQIVILDGESLAVDFETTVPGGVRAFHWDPTGRQIAFLSPDPPEVPAAAKHGAVIDKRTFVVYKLLGNDLFIDAAKPVHLNLLTIAAKSVRSLLTEVHVEDAAWAPDGKSILVTGKESAESGSSTIYLYSLATGTTRKLLEGAEEKGIATLEYSRPTWSPDGTEFAVISKTNQDRWASSGSIGIYSLKTSKYRELTKEDRVELYGERMFWLEKLGLLVENTVQARTQLFRVSASGALEAVVKQAGQNSSFSLSSSGEQAVYVHQDFGNPPDIFTSRFPFAISKQVTELNAASGRLARASTERIHWSGAGGLAVEGLLITPPNYARGQRYPLLVMVHGGPGFAVKDTFEPYGIDSQNWVWPYPFRIFAEQGYLVFFPNYRGTGSYGKQFRMFQDMAGEPAEDIVSGVRYLIDRGDADPKLVGILGHSHGAWLGPYVLAHHKDMFKAASFAEGDLDFISNYGQMPGRLNLFTHEFYNPGTPYENVQRYIDLSPIFAFRGLTAPTLLEFGQRSLAVAGLESVSALWREGVPHEMIVYPGEGHNLASPVLQLESMHRNLDWFNYWMLGKKEPEREEQYQRWQRMAAEMKQMRETNAAK